MRVSKLISLDLLTWHKTCEGSIPSFDFMQISFSYPPHSQRESWPRQLFWTTNLRTQQSGCANFIPANNLQAKIFSTTLYPTLANQQISQTAARVYSGGGFPERIAGSTAVDSRFPLCRTGESGRAQVVSARKKVSPSASVLQPRTSISPSGPGSSRQTGW